MDMHKTDGGNYMNMHKADGGTTCACAKKSGARTKAPRGQEKGAIGQQGCNEKAGRWSETH